MFRSLLALAVILVGLSSPCHFAFAVASPFADTHVAHVAADTLVFCPHEFQPAIKRWVEYRKSQGHVLSVVAPAPSPFGIKAQIRGAATSGKLENIVIFGDSADQRARPDELVPTDYARAKVNVLYGSEPEIATDNTYADLNNDGVPDLTIGRLPFDSAAEIESFVDRIIKYESKSNAGAWQRRINLVAGVGGLGPVIDGMVERTTRQMITEIVPGEYKMTMTYGSWSSPYCPDPRRFSESSIERFNEGCLFWVYLGHGSRYGLDRVRLPDQDHVILTNPLVSKLNCQSGSPIAIFLACYTGATDQAEDGLAETMLRQQNGPIAAICGTRVTMPYAMSLLSLEMAHEYFDGQAETIGDLMLLAKQRLVGGSDNHPQYQEMIGAMGKIFSPTATLLKMERLEHVQLMHLVGDPLLRLKRPQTLSIAVSEDLVAGGQLKVRGTAIQAGQLTLELAYQRDRFRKRPPRRRHYDSSDHSFKSYQDVYEQTQKLTCVSHTSSVGAGAFEIKLDIPADVAGRCVVRAMLAGPESFAMDAQRIEIQKSSVAATQRTNTVQR